MGKRTRIALIGAAVLFLTSIFVPYWLMTMTAPPYPNQMLKVSVHGDRLEGDVVEWHRVSRLVGVTVPPPMPEIDFKVMPIAMIASAALALLAALTRRRVLSISACFLAWTVSVGMLGVLQYRLYLIGHDLDPTAPLRFFVKGGFTPPAIGKLTVGSITTYHIPHVGTALTFAAILILTAAVFHPQTDRLWRKLFRRSTTVSEMPEATAGV
ncbi:MAG: hypothetical protein QF672_04040 [SAR202 cluster bacterium]|jgi:copper chaperone NosL|nr:hypothetical protein [SAR202 cluster bacterium]